MLFRLVPSVIAYLFLMILLCEFFCCGNVSHKPLSKMWQSADDHLTLIYKGRDTQIDKLPWLAQLQLDDGPHCGGVVMSAHVTITSAHCVVDEGNKLIDAKRFSVLVGSSIELLGQKHRLCKIIKHPKFRKGNIPFYYYDIALTILKGKIKYNDNVKPAQIVPNDNWRDTRYTFVVAGFGVVTNEDDSAERLKRTRMRYVDNKTCNNSKSVFGKGRMPVPSHMFCMVGDKETSDCRGDSGSGVMWSDYVIGIVSTGRVPECGSKTVPYMYIDLTYFRKWIQNIISKYERKECA